MLKLGCDLGICPGVSCSTFGEILPRLQGYRLSGTPRDDLAASGLGNTTTSDRPLDADECATCGVIVVAWPTQV